MPFHRPLQGFRINDEFNISTWVETCKGSAAKFIAVPKPGRQYNLLNNNIMAKRGSPLSNPPG